MSWKNVWTDSLANGNRCFGSDVNEMCYAQMPSNEQIYENLPAQYVCSKVKALFSPERDEAEPKGAV